jgi:hypothetical protein
VAANVAAMTRVRVRVAVGLAAASVLAACGTSSQNPPAQNPPPSGSGTVSATPAPPPLGEEVLGNRSVVLDDGRHPVILKSVDVPKRRITFDLIVFLTGAEAKTEFQKRHPGEEGPMNDYFIVNDNPRLRTLPFATGATIKVVGADTVGGAANEEIDVPGLNKYAGFGLFWITVASGKITLMEEQFVP